MSTKKRWMHVPPKLPKPKVPEYPKAVVKTRADEFVESFLKPHFIKEPPKDYQWNYRGISEKMDIAIRTRACKD